jgi:hypothetical protein
MLARLPQKARTIMEIEGALENPERPSDHRQLSDEPCNARSSKVVE